LLACYAVSDVRPNSLRTRWPWCSGAGVKGLSDTVIKAGVAFTKRLGDRVKFVTAPSTPRPSVVPGTSVTTSRCSSGLGNEYGCGMVPVRRATPSGVPLIHDATDPGGETDGNDAPTDPTALRKSDGALRGQGDADGESRAPDQEAGRRSFLARLGGRAVLLPLACVAALLIGFASVTAVLRLTDRPAPPDAKPVPTTAPPAAPAPAAAPAITTPPTSAAKARAVANEPTPPPPAPEPAPAPQAEAPETPPPPSTTTPSTTTPSTTTPTTTTPSP
jgi:hypothetical protein